MECCMNAMASRHFSAFVVVILFAGLCSAVCPDSRHQTGFAGYALSPDTKRIAALSEDGTLFWWDITSGKHTQLQECIKPDFFHPILFSPDSNNLAVKVGNTVQIFSISSGQTIASLGSSNLHNVIDMVFSADGMRLAAIDGQHIVLWQIKNQSEIAFISEINDR